MDWRTLGPYMVVGGGVGVEGVVVACVGAICDVVGCMRGESVYSVKLVGVLYVVQNTAQCIGYSSC